MTLNDTELSFPLNGFPFKARYKSRVPDPGICRVVSIDWEAGEISMTNGSNRYFPLFEEIEIVD